MKLPRPASPLMRVVILCLLMIGGAVLCGISIGNHLWPLAILFALVACIGLALMDVWRPQP